MLRLKFPRGELQNFDRRLYKMRSRTMDSRLKDAEEIVAVNEGYEIPIRCLDGVYVKDGIPTIVFVRA